MDETESTEKMTVHFKDGTVLTYILDAATAESFLDSLYSYPCDLVGRTVTAKRRKANNLVEVTETIFFANILYIEWPDRRRLACKLCEEGDEQEDGE